MVVDRRRYPQRSSDPGEPLMVYVNESLSQVEHQIWLLRNVFWWYLLPPSILLMAFSSMLPGIVPGAGGDVCLSLDAAESFCFLSMVSFIA